MLLGSFRRRLNSESDRIGFSKENAPSRSNALRTDRTSFAVDFLTFSLSEQPLKWAFTIGDVGFIAVLQCASQYSVQLGRTRTSYIAVLPGGVRELRQVVVPVSLTSGFRGAFRFADAARTAARSSARRRISVSE